MGCDFAAGLGALTGVYGVGLGAQNVSPNEQQQLAAQQAHQMRTPFGAGLPSSARDLAPRWASDSEIERRINWAVGIPTACEYCRRPRSDSFGKQSCVGCGAPV